MSWLTSVSAFAAIDPNPASLQSEIKGHKSTSFNPLLQQWDEKYGAKAVLPLMKVATDPRNTDPDRYVAIMGTARLGGTEAAPLLLPLLKDSSWMIRNGALRAISALGNPKASSAVLPLLHDPALVVRLEAVDAVQKLRPTGSVDALVEILERAENYHGGRAQWIPQKSLAAIAVMGDASTAPKLRSLLDHGADRDLIRRTIETLHALTGKKLAEGKPVAEQIRAWKRELSTSKKN